MKGKFDSLKDQVIYRATLDGSADSIGSVDGFGFYALVDGFYGSDYILQEDSQGFVMVSQYPLGDAQADWQQLCQDYEDWGDQ